MIMILARKEGNCQYSFLNEELIPAPDIELMDGT